MITLKIFNSECILSGLSEIEFKKLKELMSYEISAQAHFFSGGYRSNKRSLLDKGGRFPTGLLYILESFIKHYMLQVKVIDTRVVPKFNGGLFTAVIEHPAYPDQIEASEAALKHGRGIICAPTGVGKSIIAALIIQKLQVPTLVVVPSLELKRQLTETLSRTFGSDKLGKGKGIWVENVDSIPNNKILTGYDCVIIDEFHHSGAKTYRKLNKKAFSNIYYKIGLTATPFRSQDNEKLLLESVLSQVIYKIDYQKAISSKYIVPLEAYYYELPKTETKGTTWAAVYSELVVNNSVRNELIASIISSLHSNRATTLCLVKEIKHGEILKEMTGSWFAHGENDETPWYVTLFNQGKLKTLIGTTGVLGEGVDTKPAEFIIIAGLGKSPNAFVQQCGRGFRNYPGKETCKVILFKDPSHKWTKEHFKAQCKHLLDFYGVKPVKLK